MDDPLLLILFILLTLFLAVTLIPGCHMLVHALAARRVGLALDDLRIWPLHARRRSGRIRWRLDGLSSPPYAFLLNPFSSDEASLTRDLAIVARAGAFGYLAHIAVGAFIVAWGHGHPATLGLGLFVIVMATVLILRAWLGSGQRFMGTDAWVSRILEGDDDEAASLMNAARLLYFITFTRVRPANYPCALVAYAEQKWSLRDVASGQFAETHAAGRLLALHLVDMSRWDEAETVLREMLDRPPDQPLDPRYFDWSHLYLAVVLAIGKRDGAGAQAVLHKVRPAFGARHVSLLWGARAAAAFVQGDRDAAVSQASKALKMTSSKAEPSAQIALECSLWNGILQSASTGLPLQLVQVPF